MEEGGDWSSAFRGDEPDQQYTMSRATLKETRSSEKEWSAYVHFRELRCSFDQELNRTKNRVFEKLASVILHSLQCICSTILTTVQQMMNMMKQTSVWANIGPYMSLVADVIDTANMVLQRLGGKDGVVVKDGCRFSAADPAGDVVEEEGGEGRGSWRSVCACGWGWERGKY